MNGLLAALLFAAEPSRSDTVLNGLRGGFQGHGMEPRDIVVGVAVLVAIIATVWLVAYLLTRRDRNRSYDSPYWLFFSLCHAHHLRWIECWWLWRLARCQRLSTPALLFLEPDRLQQARLTPALWTKAALFQRLHDSLFAGLVDEEVGTPPKPVPLEKVESTTQRPGASPLPPTSSRPTLDAPVFVPVPDTDGGPAEADWFGTPAWTDRSPEA
jgi:hypothetical protein